MDTGEKQHILEAITTVLSEVAGLRAEIRTRFDRVDGRLDTLEETVEATSKTLDTLLEGSTLGTDHITLIRPEYDGLMKVTNLPNRFVQSA